MRSRQGCVALSILGINRSAIELLIVSEKAIAYQELIEVRSPE
ncbi:hypothetical protein ACE1CD_10375 [Aerosakkonema sp. BLCC-F183]